VQLTVREAAALLRVPEETVHRWIKTRGIPATRVNEQVRFHRAELLEWATAQGVGVSADIFQTDGSAAAGKDGLHEALVAGGIVYGLRGGDVASVLRAAVRAVRLPDCVDRERLLELLVAREALSPTGIGDGIAIPHVRNPIILEVQRPTIGLCFLESPVDFHALDGRPVRCLFLLISPTIRAHLAILSRLAFALRDPGVREAVRRQGPPDEILAGMRRVESGFTPSVPPERA